MHAHGALKHEIVSSVASGIAQPPSAPDCIERLASGLAHGLFAVASTPAGRVALEELRAGLFAAAGREREAGTLWKESLATAAYAELLASVTGASIGAASLGGLLHRAGEAWLLRTMAESERESGARLDPHARGRMSAAESAACSQRLVRDWKLPPVVAECVLGWRRCGEHEAVTREASAVYVGRLLALELLQPQFCAPGATGAALAELGFEADALARVRQSDLRVLRLIRSFD